MCIDIAVNLICHEKYLLEKPTDSIICETVKFTRQLPIYRDIMRNICSLLAKLPKWMQKADLHTIQNKFGSGELFTISQTWTLQGNDNFRVSAHNLAMECYSYTRPPTPVNDRICYFLLGNIIENESHFLMKCKRPDNEWEILHKF